MNMALRAKHTLNSQEIDGNLQPVSNFCLIKVKESMGETVGNLDIFVLVDCVRLIRHPSLF